MRAVPTLQIVMSKLKPDKVFDNQTKILEWLLSCGHEIDDKHLQPDPPTGGLDRWLDSWTTTRRIHDEGKVCADIRNGLPARGR